MKILILLFLTIFLIGCATANYSVGTPINAENVSKIEHGKTTKEDLISLFGQPYTKTPLAANQEKWIYTFVNTTAKAQSYIVSMKVDSQGTQQILDLIIEDGLVVNHTFTDGPIQQVKVN